MKLRQNMDKDSYQSQTIILYSCTVPYGPIVIHGCINYVENMYGNNSNINTSLFNNLVSFILPISTLLFHSSAF